MKARWTRWLATALLAALPLVAAGPALAQVCPPLDVTCVVGDVEQGVQGTIDDTVGTVTDTVDPIVNDTVDEVDQILGGGDDTPPPGGGGGGDGDDGGGDGGSGDGDAAGGPAPGRSALPLGLRTSTTIGAPAVAAEPPVQLDTGTDLRERFATAIAGAARSLVVVAILLGIAVAFVLTQDRIDRSDPRLALAPVESDLVRFA
jgi:hypothetical protein